MDTVNIFYNEILSEGATGVIDCEFPIRVIFNTIITEDNTFLKADQSFQKVIIPTLIISNKEAFNKALIEYVNNALAFYTEKRLSYVKNPIKYIIGSAMANMTASDFQNPCNYFKRLTNFLQAQSFQSLQGRNTVGFSKILNSNIEFTINKEPLHEEAPYSIQIYATKQDNGSVLEYKFQTIRFGISDNKVYIYAIQHSSRNEMQENDKTKEHQKQINRKCFKANEGVDVNNALSNVNPGAVIALSIFISILHSLNIKEILIPPFLLQRWNDKEIKYTLIEREYGGRELPENIKIRYIKAKEENNQHEALQRNINEKLKNALYRINYHFSNTMLSKTDDYGIALSLGNTFESENKILNELSELSQEYIKSRNFKL